MDTTLLESKYKVTPINEAVENILISMGKKKSNDNTVSNNNKNS
jgi:hypothetical protein